MNQSKTSMIMYGPQGVGKTRNAKAIANAFGLQEIIDPWSPNEDLPPINGALVITNSPPRLSDPRFKRYRMMEYKFALDEIDQRARQTP